MGIIRNLFSNKRKEKNTLIKEDSIFKVSTNQLKTLEEGPDLLVKTNNINTPADQARFITDNCEQILESTRQLEEVKREYQAVTSYLTDIQKMDQIPSEDREQLNDTARKIITLTRERAKYQNSTKNISDIQYKHIAKFQDTIQADMKKMKENEVYQNNIKNDMQHLEGEKGWLFGQVDETTERQNYLKGIAVATCTIVFILFGLFIIIGNLSKADMEIPFLMTIVMAIIASVYLFTNARNNKKDMKLNELKLNRAINLLNKVKIKYVNNTNTLDYTYQKYMVNSYSELNYLWEQYIKAKEDEKLYRRNTEQLESYHKELIADLRNFGLADPDIWIYQAAAIIDSKEMVEVRHRLNVRRQKLRDLIDYNTSIKDKCVNEIKEFLEKKPENKNEVVETLKKFGVYL
jgi:hypothetical protein